MKGRITIEREILRGDDYRDPSGDYNRARSLSMRWLQIPNLERAENPFRLQQLLPHANQPPGPPVFLPNPLAILGLPNQQAMV
jgi:hypothetical protein